jgi:hypothetical protein
MRILYIGHVHVHVHTHHPGNSGPCTIIYNNDAISQTIYPLL